eukprot:Clim_evm1s155 gene=Clim_evmTU1s155
MSLLPPHVAETRQSFQQSPLRRVSTTSKKLRTLAWSPDGTKLAAGGGQDSMKSYSATVYSNFEQTPPREVVLKGHTESVDHMCWHPKKPDILVTATQDMTMRFWDTKSGKCLKIIQTDSELYSITWSLDCQYIAFLSKRDSIIIYNANTYKMEAKKEDFNASCIDAKFDANNRLFFGNKNGCILIMEVPSMKHIHTILAHKAPCLSIAFSPDQSLFATGGEDAIVNIYDAAELVCLRTVTRTEWPANMLSFNSTGKLLAIGGEDRNVFLVDVDTGLIVHKIKVTGVVDSVVFHPKTVLKVAYVEDTKDAILNIVG